MKMEIKTSFDILKLFETYGNHLTEEQHKKYDEFRSKRWISVEDLIKFIKDFPSCHYSSLEKDRVFADKIVNKLIEELKKLKPQPPRRLI